MAEKRYKGKIARMVVDKGFGFINVEGMRDDVFFHKTSLPRGQYEDLSEGDTVEFRLADTPKGARAEDVLIVG